MYKNPKLVKEYMDKVEALERGLYGLKRKLFEEKSKVPDGYKLLKEGEIVSKDAACFEPCHGTWEVSGGNCTGKAINDEGYVTGIVHRGWKFANPI